MYIFTYAVKFLEVLSSYFLLQTKNAIIYYI